MEQRPKGGGIHVLIAVCDCSCPMFHLGAVASHLNHYDCPGCHRRLTSGLVARCAQCGGTICTDCIEKEVREKNAEMQRLSKPS